jgi:hypothetical protein
MGAGSTTVRVVRALSERKRRTTPVVFLGYLDSPTMQQNRSREASVVATWFAALCGLGFVSSFIPAVEQAVSSLLWTIAGAVVLTGATWWIARRVRWYREDREDEQLAATWRAEHAAEATTARDRSTRSAA